MGTQFWPFDTISSSNSFLWSVTVNFCILALVILYTHFQNFNMRGVAIALCIGASEIFGLAMTIVNAVRWRKFKKKYDDIEEHTKEDREEYREKNSAVGYLWYWIVGTVVSYILMIIPFSACKLLL